MSHASARTTFHGRMIIVQRHLAGWPQAHIARAMGVSRGCVARWVARYEAEGPAGLHDRSSRPLACPSRTSEQVEQRVLQARVDGRLGQDRIAQETGVPARTVSRILRRHRVPYLRDLDPITGDVIRASKATAVRYERGRPGELVHMDVKKVGRIPDGGGWRAHGRGSRQITRGRRDRVGFDFVHSMVDDCSRMAYSESLPDEKGPTCAGFLLRAADWFAERGVTIEAVLTDNHLSYRRSHDVRDAIALMGPAPGTALGVVLGDPTTEVWVA